MSRTYTLSLGILFLDRLGDPADIPLIESMAVRLLGLQRGERVSSPLIAKLQSPDASVRSGAALALGFAEAKSAVDPLIRLLGDREIPVRANVAWALGRLEDGKALAPLVPLVRDAVL